MMKQLLNTLLFLATGLFACSQPLAPIDPDYYGVPVKIPVFLAGNFAELRSNHFHGGIDIKTQGRTGISIYSAADGFISRIAVSPGSYGNAIYIDHPNGTTTVYGHLDRFTPPVEEYIRKIQYEKEQFTINQFVPEGLFPVKKGDQIAKSGNSGSSGGPHLHFEIRRTKEEIMVNPLLFNFPVQDKIRPTIQALMIYPLSADASVSGIHTPERFETVQVNSVSQLKIKKVIPVYGKIGFGIQTIDFLDGSSNKCGIYSLKLSVDNQLIYSFTMNEYALNESKYINSHIDYEQAVRTGKRVYRTWLEPGNKLNIYDKAENRGMFLATDGKIHRVDYEISDVSGNTTHLSFEIQSQETNLIQKEPKGKLFRYNRDNRIRNEELELSVPEGALYQTVDFEYEKKPALPKYYSPVYQLHHSSVALHFACPLRIKADDLPLHLHDKVMLTQINPLSGKIISATGNYVDGWVEGNIRVLGDYTLSVDTVAPKIVALSITGKTTLKDASRLQFKVTDNLSGIESFRGTIDDKWVLFEYDLKNNLISYTFDQSRFQFNKNHTLNLEVTDYKNNTNTYQAKFFK